MFFLDHLKILKLEKVRNFFGKFYFSLKLFYEDGKLAFFTLSDDDINELPYVINRLKAVTPGCEVSLIVILGCEVSLIDTPLCEVSTIIIKTFTAFKT